MEYPRHRIIIVGIRDDIDVEFKVPSNAPYAQVDNTCRTAIEVPPIPEDAPNNDLTKQSPTVVERLGYIKPIDSRHLLHVFERL